MPVSSAAKLLVLLSRRPTWMWLPIVVVSERALNLTSIEIMVSEVRAVLVRLKSSSWSTAVLFLK